MARTNWFVELIKVPFRQRYFLAEMTRLPVLGNLVDRIFFKGDDILYLPIDRVIEVGEEIDQPEETVLPSQVVEHFIDKANYLFIMNHCICREASGCEDYPVEMGCLFLGEAARGINPQTGRRVTREQAKAYVRRCREAGLVHMIGRNKMDTLWLDTGPGDRLLSICNCCPCCCIWRMLPNLAPQISNRVHKMPGVEVTVTGDCQACGVCAQGVCFVDAIHLDGNSAVITEACRGCGRCVDACPHGAIQLSINDEHTVQAAIDRIAHLVDVT